MSYDLDFIDKNTKEVIKLPTKHGIKGGMYDIEGSCWLSFNITYNYYPFFKKVFGEKGIRSLYGLTAKEARICLEKAISELKGDPDPDYWKPTEGNALEALYSLLFMARLAPDDSIVQGD